MTIDIREFTISDSIKLFLSQFHIFRTYEGLIMGNPAEAAVKESVFSGRLKRAENYLGHIPCACLSRFEDFPEGEPLGEFWHVAEVSCYDDLDYGPLMNDNDIDADFAERSVYGFSWLGKEPSFLLGSPAVERLLKFDWLQKSLLIGDFLGIVIERRGDKKDG